MKKKGWTSLTVKLNGLILAIVLVLSIGLAAFAYHVNSERVNKYYMQTTSHAARNSRRSERKHWKRTATR